METSSDYAAVCFVLMPFGKKEVTMTDDSTREVDFDFIYKQVFEPAIEATPLPDDEAAALGETHLVPRRTDRDFFTGLITQDMFEYLHYARCALADLSGLNANVFYELGVRHATVESGTAIFRQQGAPIPFDIRTVKAFDYTYEPQEEVAKSRALITRVLTESLVHNRLDSPVQQALRAQRQYGQGVKDLLQEAENCIRRSDWRAAAAAYEAAAKQRPRDPVIQFQLGLMHKHAGRFEEAHTHFAAAARIDADYGEACREQGIAESQLHRRGQHPDTGETALKRAIRLNPTDFDAMASLGGVLKRQGRMAEAIGWYDKAAEASQHHSYPLLNKFRLQILRDGGFDLSESHRFQLNRAKYQLEGQVNAQPPTDPPWCFFDLAETHLYLGDGDGFLDLTRRGTYACDHRWQAETFRDSLQALSDAGIPLPKLDEGRAWLDDNIPNLPT